MQVFKTILMLFAFTMLAIVPAFLINGCSDKSTTNSTPQDPPDQGTLLVSRLSVSVVPGASETITVSAMDPYGSNEDCTITCSNPAVVMATITNSTVNITGVAYGTANVTVTSGSDMTRTIPVQVYNPYMLDTGELLVAFVDTFTQISTDSQHEFHLSDPVVPEGFHALGSMVTYPTNPNGNRAMMVVKAKEGSDALAAPLGYEILFTHAFVIPQPFPNPPRFNIIRFWVPIPPDGYVALGCAATAINNHGDPNAEPPLPLLDRVVCVRQDLTADAEAGTCIISGSAVGFWIIDQRDAGPHEYFNLVTGTVFGWDHSDPPTQHEVLHVLKVQLPMLAEAPYQSFVPELTSYDTPAAETVPTLSKAMLAPCTIVNDPAYSGVGDIHWRVANSPLYRLERQVYYKLLYHNHNRTGAEQTNSVTIRSGITTTESERIWNETQISVSVEMGLSVKAFNGKVTGTFSRRFGYETQTSVAELQETEISTSINTLPNRAAACWQKYNRYVLYRHDGTDLVPVTSWEFGIDSYVVDDYAGE